MVKTEVKETIRKSRILYNSLIVGTLIILLSFDNHLRKSIRKGDYSYFIPYFSILLISYFFFYVCGKNPGYSNNIIQQTEQTREIELQNPIHDFDNSQLSLEIRENNNQERRNSLLSSHTAFSNDFPSPEREYDNDIEDSISAIRGISRNRHLPSFSPSNYSCVQLPQQRYCEVCKIVQPYRAKHCHQCEKCICKFDHHCGWIGGCVGELNQRKFWAFVFFQTILQVWTYVIASSGLDAIYKKTYDPKEEGDNPIDYLDDDNYERIEYILFMIIGFLSFISTLFTGGLLVFQTVLILTNQSAWEFRRKDALSYLKIYPKDFYPFSKGPWENIKMVFFHKNKIKKWELPPATS